MTINALQVRLATVQQSYATCTGGQMTHFGILQRIRELRSEIDYLTRPRTVIDWNCTLEGKLIAAKVPFSLDILPVPCTNGRDMWVAAVHVGEVSRA